MRRFWKPPLAGVFKFYVDGALFNNLQEAGVGAVLRDEMRNVIMAMSKIDNEVDDADDIEALATLRALQLILSHWGERYYFKRRFHVDSGSVEVFHSKYDKAKSFVLKKSKFC